MNAPAYLIKNALHERLLSLPLRKLVRGALMPGFSPSQERLVAKSTGLTRKSGLITAMTDLGGLGKKIHQGQRSGLKSVMVGGVR
jgi:hypothetical protein